MKSYHIRTMIRKAFFLGIIACFNLFVFGQKVNYDESKVMPYTLPDPLITNNGKQVTTQKEWIKKRRPEILDIFATQMYGKAPAKPKNIHFKVVSEDKQALGGMAIRKEVKVCFFRDSRPNMIILVYLPNQRKTPVPVFLGFDFQGNCTTDDDLLGNPVLGNEGLDTPGVGLLSAKWSVTMLLERGYGLVSIKTNDLDPGSGFQQGVYPLFYAKGQDKPKSDEWGTIAAWAWGHGRAMDYIETDNDIDAKHVAIIGHSRQGKAVLWAGASDERFALAVSNNSGCCGAALSKRRFGETLSIINTSFPNWFCTNLKKYNDNEGVLPMDQHELIALIAPRLVYIASAEKDLWADPKGEFLSGIYANPVYALFGLTGLPSTEMPPLNQPVQSGYIGYHFRSGQHDLTKYDWMQYLNFADKHFK